MRRAAQVTRKPTSSGRKASRSGLPPGRSMLIGSVRLFWREQQRGEVAVGHREREGVPLLRDDRVRPEARGPSYIYVEHGDLAAEGIAEPVGDHALGQALGAEAVGEAVQIRRG